MDFATANGVGVTPSIGEIITAIQQSMPSAPKGFDVPNIPTPTPLIPQGQMQNLVGQALAPGGAPITANDKSMALAKLGIALMQPRQHGESVGGNIGKAVNTGIDTLQASKDKAQAQAVQRAQLASTMASADLQRQQTTQAMEIARAKFPAEMAKFQLEYNNLVLRGETERAELVKAKFAEAVMEQDYEMKRRKEEADLKLKEAQTGQASAHADVYKAQAEAFRAGIDAGKKPIQKTYQDDQGRVMVATTIDGETYFEVFTPPMPEADALRQAKIEVDAEWKEKYGANLGWLDWKRPPESEYKKAIAERAAKLMQGKRESVGPKYVPKSKSTAGGKASVGKTEADFRRDVPNETAAQRREKALGVQITALENELADPRTTDEDRAAIQKELEKLQKVGTSLNPHTVARARKPDSVREPLYATPEFVRTPEGKVVPAGRLSKPAPTAEGKEGEAPLVQARREQRASDAAVIEDVKGFVKGVQSSTQKAQINALREKMKEKTLTPQEKALIRRLAMDGHFTEEELKAAGVPLPPKKK